MPSTPRPRHYVYPPRLLAWVIGAYVLGFMLFCLLARPDSSIGYRRQALKELARKKISTSTSSIKRILRYAWDIARYVRD